MARLMVALWFLQLLLVQWRYQHILIACTVRVFSCPPHMLGLSSFYLLSLFTGHQTAEWRNYQTGGNWFSVLLFCIRGVSSPLAEGLKFLKLLSKTLEESTVSFPSRSPIQFLLSKFCLFIYFFSYLTSSTLWVSLTLPPQPTDKCFHKRSLCFSLLCFCACWISPPVLSISHASPPA